MANNRKVLQRFDLLVDGVSKLGVARSVSPPEITVVTARYAGAGMDGSVPIDRGIGGLVFGFELYDYDPTVTASLGFQEGRQFRIEARAVFEPATGAKEQRIFRAAGMLVRSSPGSLTADDGAGNFPVLTAEVDCTFYAEFHEGREVAYIDLVNNIRRIGGVDRNAGFREVLGSSAGGGTVQPALTAGLTAGLTVGVEV